MAGLPLKGKQMDLF